MNINKLRYIIILTVAFVHFLAARDIMEEKGYIRNPRIIEDGFVFTDNYTSAIYLYRNGKTEVLIDSRGSGLYYTLAPDIQKAGFKFIDQNGMQSPAIIDLNNGEIRRLTEPSQRVGQPGFTRDGRVAYTVGSRLIISDGREIDLGIYSNIAPISPDGENACYNDDNDQLWIIDLQTGERSVITDSESGYYYPQWSPNSRYILYSGFDSKIWVYDRINDRTFNLGGGHQPTWSDDSEWIIFYKKEIENFELLNTDIYTIRFDGTNQKKITDTKQVFEIDPVFSNNDRQVLYHVMDKKEFIISDINIQKSEIYNPRVIKPISDEKSFLPSPSVKPFKSESEGMQVPYLHQVYDVPNWFWGYYACAPTAAAMVLAYYNILPRWETRCLSPYSHTSYWGRYICERYYYRETDYSYSSSPDGHTAGKGGYGYMWGTGGSPNSKMLNYYQKHGLTASQTYSTTWSQTTSDINAGHPYTMCVWLTGPGHLVLAKGIVEGKKTLVFNDPYGNKNTAGYPSYDGSGALYDWPGYNEGNVNLASAGSGIPWCISTRYTKAVRADTLVDDMHLENGFYLHTQSPASMSLWKDKKAGHNGHYWWCYSRTSVNEDTCYATWTPNLPSLAHYDVYVYIPSSDQPATNAVYSINHADSVSQVSIDQSQFTDQWIFLGNYIFRSGTDSYVKLGDASGIAGQKLVFDAVKWSIERPVTVDFIAEFQSGNAPLTVQFSNISEYLPEDCTIRWDFDDGNISTERNPIHIFRAAGDYTVSLTVEYVDTAIIESKTTYIHVDSPVPGDFSLIVPEKESIIATRQPLFYWVPTVLSKGDRELFLNILRDKKANHSLQIPLKDSMSSTTYQLFLNTTSDFGNTVSIEIDTNFYKPDDPLIENAEYFWKVKMISAANDTLTSAVWSFKVNSENSPPEAFSLLSPAVDEVLQDLTPTFHWNAAADPDVNDQVIYRLKIGTGLDDFIVIYEGENTSITLEDSLLDNTVYYWLVEATDRSGAMTVNDENICSFTINLENDPPSPVVLLTPGNNGYIFTEYPLFQWTAALDVDPYDELLYYLYYWRTDATRKYTYGTDTTYCDRRKVKLDYEYVWYVETVDKAGARALSDTFTFRTSSLDIATENLLPKTLALYQNYPNPFNPVTTIRFDLPETADIRLTIYDVKGRQVKTLVDGKRKARIYSAIWNGKDGSGRPVSAGVYIFTLKYQDVILSKKMIFLK